MVLEYGGCMVPTNRGKGRGGFEVLCRFFGKTGEAVSVAEKIIVHSGEDISASGVSILAVSPASSTTVE